jgi:hypothetical protein
MAVTANSPKAVSGVIDGDCKGKAACGKRIAQHEFQRSEEEPCKLFCKLSVYWRSISRSALVSSKGEPHCSKRDGPSPRDGGVLAQAQYVIIPGLRTQPEPKDSTRVVLNSGEMDKPAPRKFYGIGGL